MDGQIKHTLKGGDEYKKKQIKHTLKGEINIKKQMKHKSSTPQILSPLLINHNRSIQGNHINVCMEIYYHCVLK